VATAILLWVPAASGVAATTCRVLDLELQVAYTGGCRDGLAEGMGEARGTAHYKGGFRAGRKHGNGVKTWASGDRYDGEFVNDRMEGVGSYSWGRNSPWMREHYTGDFLNDQRHGFGVYEWPSGDRYAGPWKHDRPAGEPTLNMLVRARAYGELAAAVGIPGVRVCRTFTVGISTEDQVRGTVIAAKGHAIAIRIDDAGRFQHLLNGKPLMKGETVRDILTMWAPCIWSVREARVLGP
jgi:hypothetical protein